LIDEFGQNPIIDDIVSIAHHILHLNIHATPLMQALTSLELLLGKLETYEKIASKSLNSLQEQIVLVKQLIIRYRKIQILSWKNLMASEINSCIKDDYANFISLSFALNSVTEEREQVFQTLDLYLRTSNIAQFENRLVHLQIIEEQSRTLKNRMIENLANFVRRYYAQFVPTLTEEKRDLEQKAKEKIQTLVDVSKWSVQKFTIIKSNIDRTH
jgi:midasin (ATPase involved in ribosome maturation)